jgi:hypothetical protein
MNRLRWKDCAIAFSAGLLLFEAGLLILHRNPYWQITPKGSVVPHRVYAWNSISHVISAMGLIAVLGSALYLLSRLFSAKWLYWTGVLAAIVLWCGMLGVTHTYVAHYGWDATTGITEFAISNTAAPIERENAVWEAIVRWQVEPELNGWLRAGSLKRTHGWLSIKVVRIAPLALPSIDCDCFNCCAEEDTATSRR